MSAKIITDFDLCTGCALCQLECSMQTEGGYNPRLAKLKLHQGPKGLFTEPVVCNQCQNAYCEKVCPADAFERDNKWGIPLINKEKCIGCALCMSYCPREVIVLLNKKAAKCNLCDGNPACVKRCPTGALKYWDGGELND
ncbi:4Fe-4S dicluster domain-containing protein [Dethiobacter alkaliphilus]|nr:4Fe-4S dicluster domain-containing protein [Dethiobacter alkaliphilus]